MGMALKSDVTKACSQMGTQKPLDLVHLSSLTMGDRGLELDLLKMFAGQIEQYQDSLKNSCDDTDDLKRVAHTIKGAAKSVGAFGLAELAQKAEDTGYADLKEFEEEMKAIRGYICELV